MDNEWKDVMSSMPGHVLEDNYSEIYSVRKNEDHTWTVFVLHADGSSPSEGYKIEEVGTCGTSEELHVLIYELEEGEISGQDEMHLDLESLDEIYWRKAMAEMPGEYIGGVTSDNMAGFCWEEHYSIKQTLSGDWNLYRCVTPYHDESETEDKLYAEPEIEEVGSYPVDELDEALKEAGFSGKFITKLIERIKA